MSNMMFGKGPKPPQAQPDTVKEPFPVSDRTVAGMRLPGLRRPPAMLAYGISFIMVGLLLFWLSLEMNPGDGAALGIFLLCIFAGVGILMIVTASVRWRWYHENRRRHGRPF
jgi:hypothetical protein